jgi:CTP synthase (UTP-ammonia lyase)
MHMNATITRIALIGDYSERVIAHRGIDASIQLARECIAPTIIAQWLHTSSIAPGESLDGFHGIWCVPASPYANTDGALWAIHWARTQGVPFLGSCGGFQHALMEIIGSISGQDAAHAELEPHAPDPLIAPLACALVERRETITPLPGRFADCYGAARTEGFHCSFGLNPAHEQRVVAAGVKIAARGPSGEVRAFELPAHPFFIATLFQPERAALQGELHPLVRAFIAAATERGSGSL